MVELMELGSNIDIDTVSDGELERLVNLFLYMGENKPELLKKNFFKGYDKVLIKFREAYDCLEDMHKNPLKYKEIKSKTKGDLLESVIKILFINTKLFKIYNNIKSSTNEYDILILPSEYLKISGKALDPLFRMPIMCECKNYSGKVDVTWIGKFYTVLKMSDIKLGIIFSYNGVTGSNNAWSAGKGLIKKIFLKDGIAILNICKEDFQNIYQGELITDLIEKKYNNLKFDTNISDYFNTEKLDQTVAKTLNKINNELNKKTV